VDLNQGKFFVPEEKIIKIKKLVAKMLRKKTLTKRRLAGVVGYIISVARAAPLVRLYCREAYLLLGHCRTKKQWDSSVIISDALKQDWQWLVTNFASINGAPMWHPSQVHVLKTDASNDGWGAVLDHQQKAAGTFTCQQQQWHIMFKEMQAVLLAIRAFRPILKGIRFQVKTDNVAVVAYLEKGGGQWPDLNEMVKQIWQEVAQLGAMLCSTEWIRGSTENQIAVKLSRKIDGDDWFLDPKTFQVINNRWSPTIDRFADQFNTKLPRFNSRLWTESTEAVDTFTQDWSKDINYWLPPFALIHRVLRQIIEQKAVGIIVIPRWNAQPWWPMLEVITVQVMVLGWGSLIFHQGRSGQLEPTRHGDWIFEARLVNGSRTSDWA
jgi:ribonuclease HI